MRIRAQTLREFGFNQTARLHEQAADEIDMLRAQRRALVVELARYSAKDKS
jgi:hypothetical protein